MKFIFAIVLIVLCFFIIGSIQRNSPDNPALFFVYILGPGGVIYLIANLFSSDKPKEPEKPSNELTEAQLKELEDEYWNNYGK